jgi:hypothetical protein
MLGSYIDSGYILFKMLLGASKKKKDDKYLLK